MPKDNLFDEAVPEVAELVDAFMEHLKVGRSASHHTVVNYSIDLRHFVRFLAERYGPHINFDTQLSLKVLRDFLSLQVKKYKRATVARRLSLIKSFLKYLHQEGFVEKNLARLIRLPKPQLRLPNTLKAQEIMALTDQVPVDNLRHRRLRAVLELLYSAGVRISELVALNYGALDLQKGQVRVWGKGERERLVPIGLHCRAALGEYMKSVPACQKIGVDTPVFLNRFGKRISVRSIQRELKAYAIEILGPKGSSVTPHTFRHSCATHLLEAGAGLREIQELLGHRTLVTTQKYTHMDIERLKASYRSSHPKERRRRAKEVAS